MAPTADSCSEDYVQITLHGARWRLSVTTTRTHSLALCSTRNLAGGSRWARWRQLLFTDNSPSGSATRQLCYSTTQECMATWLHNLPSPTSCHISLPPGPPTQLRMNETIYHIHEMLTAQLYSPQIKSFGRGHQWLATSGGTLCDRQNDGPTGVHVVTPGTVSMLGYVAKGHQGCRRT